MGDPETFWSLLHDAAHWEFEVFLILVFDGLVGAVLWPLVKRGFAHHRGDDSKLADLERRLRLVEGGARLEEWPASSPRPSPSAPRAAPSPGS